ncbi:hypothetical protein C8R47DRAFT_69232 [Mycena vitilis]|nr:hypothetical protein C8R47DRAFT_69232 [Mycena vitilis]
MRSSRLIYDSIPFPIANWRPCTTAQDPPDVARCRHRSARRECVAPTWHATPTLLLSDRETHAVRPSPLSPLFLFPPPPPLLPFESPPVLHGHPVQSTPVRAHAGSAARLFPFPPPRRSTRAWCCTTRRLAASLAHTCAPCCSGARRTPGVLHAAASGRALRGVWRRVDSRSDRGCAATPESRQLIRTKTPAPRTSKHRDRGTTMASSL